MHWSLAYNHRLPRDSSLIDMRILTVGILSDLVVCTDIQHTGHRHSQDSLLIVINALIADILFDLVCVDLQHTSLSPSSARSDDSSPCSNHPHPSGAHLDLRRLLHLGCGAHEDVSIIHVLIEHRIPHDLVLTICIIMVLWSLYVIEILWSLGFIVRLSGHFITI
jgi:hypothetical protein